MKDFVVREFRHMLPPTIFFIVCFNVLVLTVALLAHGSGGELPTYAAATVAALVCGKAVLVADKLPFFNRYPHKPLIWNAGWKAGLYVLVALVFRLLEKLLAAATNDYGFAAGLHEEAAHFVWARFWVVQIWLLLLFLGYSAFRELIGELGRGRIMAMFFGPVRKGEVGDG
ncbi:MAG: hypothetical protein KDK03_15425 [Rhodobacteraceae bacterium]|nr:hypothetical protein [Paracoccaceae bacterium]